MTTTRDIALADRVRYHVNMFWEKAPDRRSSRTLDWLNDACEARLRKEDRHQGKITYAALMSPTSITLNSFDRKRLFRQANPARQYTGGRFPISLLVTTEPNTTGVSKTTAQAESYVLLGMKRRLGRRAAVRKYKRADIRKVTEPEKDNFRCILDLGAGAIGVEFATKFELDALIASLNLKSEPGSQTAPVQNDS
jgi:hypothetical protein